MHAADPARVGVRRLGVGQRRLQQHLHVLHRPGAARQGEGPPARRDPRRDRGAGRRGRQRDHPARPERQRLRRRVRRPEAFAKLLRACGDVEGLERVRFTSPHPAEFTDDVIEAMAETPQRDAEPAHAAAVRLGPGPQGDAALLPPGEVPRHHRPGPRRDAGRRDHHRHHRRLPGRDRGGLPGDPRRRTQRAVRGAFTFQYSKRPGTPAATLARPGRPRRSSRTATSGWSRSPTTSPGTENKALVGRAVELYGRRGRGPQGRGDPPALRPRPRQPAGPLQRRPGRCERRPAGRHGHRRGHLRRARTTWSPTARSVVRRTRAGDAWEARTAAPDAGRRHARHADRRCPGPAAGRRPPVADPGGWCERPGACRSP